MRTVRYIILTMCFCLLVGCSNIDLNDLETHNPENTTSVAELKMPEELKKLTPNPNVQWMVGMQVVLVGTEKIPSSLLENDSIYANPDNIIRAIIMLQNGLESSQRYELMVFADGVPIEFKINENVYLSYTMELTSQKKTIELEFSNEFESNMGRLDFILSFAEDPQATCHLLTCSKWIKNDNGFIQPTDLIHTINQRSGVSGCYNGDVYNSWVWNEEHILGETDSVGPSAIWISKEESLLLEAIASNPGLYRTVVIVNGMPQDIVVNGKQYSYLDWESTGSNMLQIPIILTNVPLEGSVYTVTTPLGADTYTQLTKSSVRTELIGHKGDKNGTGN